VTHVRTGAEPVAIVAAALLLALGILGSSPAITTHYGDLAFSGRGSGAKLIGVFQVSILQNLMHALLGAAGLLLARTPGRAHHYLIGAAVVVLVLWLLGVVKVGGWIPLSAADDWLHLGLGVTMLGLTRVAAEAP
jgi:hypothetical protein